MARPAESLRCRTDRPTTRRAAEASTQCRPGFPRSLAIPRGGTLQPNSLGQAALVVAARLDSSASSADSGSAVASLAKSLGDLMSRLLAKAPVEVDPLADIEDEVAKKRDQRTG